MRHMLVHGVISGYIPSKGTIQFFKLNVDVPNDIHLEERCEITVGELAEMAARSQALANLSLSLAQRITQSLVAK